MSASAKRKPSGWLPFRKDKPPERYYLLPGMGGRLAIAKRRMMLKWAFGVGLLSAGALAAFIYFSNTR